MDSGSGALDEVRIEPLTRMTEAQSSAIEAEASWRRRWRIYTPGGLKQRCRELDCGAPLIAGLIPKSSLSIAVGDSGVGKSPFLYQAAICVAAGIPFLGHPVSMGRVLYLDFENGLGDVEDLTERLSRHLGLPGAPKNLLLWNYNDAPHTWEPKDLEKMVRDAQPVWVIVDSLGAYAPDIEEKAGNVTRVYQYFREIIREYRISITVVHHLRKPSSKPQEAPPPLQEDPHGWFLQARGSRALVNGADARIGIDRFDRDRVVERVDGKSREVALVIGGFGRVRAKISTTFVARVLDEDGEPLGYEIMSGACLLFNPTQQDAYPNLPPSFRFKDAQRLYGRGPQATIDFLKKCINVGILHKDGREYKKVEVPEGPE